MSERLLPAPRAVSSNTPAGLSIFGKAEQVLEALEARGELSVAELADACGEPASSIYRLLATLTSLEWVEKGSRRGTYRLGIAFVRLASAVEWHLDIRRVVAPALRELHERTGETTYLIVRSEASGVCIDRIEGTAVRSLAMRLGDSLPLNRGGGPVALLAFVEPAIRAGLESRLCLTPDESSALDDRLEHVRDSGIAWSDEDVTPGIAACAGGVFDHQARVAAAISVSGPAEVLFADAEQIEKAVRECAAEASWAMGWDGPWPPEEAGR